MDKSISRGLIVLGLLLAIGMSLAAFIFGFQAKNIGTAKQSITVKGLAEQPIKATRAEWRIGLKLNADTLQSALGQLRKERAALVGFLTETGFDQSSVSYGSESIEPNIEYETRENGRTVAVQRGFRGAQKITVKTDDLAKIQKARALLVEFKAKGQRVESDNIEYLVGNLDAIKLSLIGVATKNAKARAQEFAKNGDVKVGVMRAASQGTFDILSADGNNEEDSYGGSFDTSSIDKIARVVVTIEYEIEK